jgi:hypothetical protein
MDEIDKISEELKTCDDPVTLASYLTKLAGWNSYYTEMLKKILIGKAEVWLHIHITGKTEQGVLHLDKELSDKKTDYVWQTTENGKRELALAYEIKRIDIMYKAISKRLWAMENEFRKLNV